MAEGSPFVEDAGPGFDPDAAAAGAEEVRHAHEAEARAMGAEAFGLPPVSEQQVWAFLSNAGDGIHAVAGVGDLDWCMTQRDLERCVPPLTRILNRYDAAKAAATYSDELAVMMGFGLYGWRSMLERVAVNRARERLTGPSPDSPGPAAPAPASSRPAPAPEPSPWSDPADPPRMAAEPSPAPAPVAPTAPGAGVGGDHFPGGGPPRDLAPQQYEVIPGYVTQAERIRQARERPVNAKPAEAPTAAR